MMAPTHHLARKTLAICVVTLAGASVSLADEPPAAEPPAQTSVEPTAVEPAPAAPAPAAPAPAEPAPAVEPKPEPAPAPEPAPTPAPEAAPEPAEPVPAPAAANPDAPVPQTEAPAADLLVFERDIRPLLKAHCWHCHGEEADPEAGLDLRLTRFLHRGGESGPAVLPNDAAGSLVYQRIASGEMPPGEAKMSAAELRKIELWINQGAKTSGAEPESLAAGDIFSQQDRDHWAFRDVQRPAVPVVPAETEVITPIDAFLWRELQRQGVAGFSPQADRATLIRRVTFGLTGLPPTPEAIAEFIADQRPDAYERLVDRLLDTAAYGERWGRHWLDIAGYADSDGYSATDPERKWAWKYRDYVVNAFNHDKPWNEFIVEQLAGDELVPQPYKNLSPEQAEKLIATGLLRMGPDGTTDSASDQNLARNDVMAETIKIVSTSLLGLSVGCAQCHAHRYDPISHADYHRIRAIFEPAYDWKNWRSAPQRLVSQWSDETRTRGDEVDLLIKQVADERNAELDQIVKDTFEQELAKLPAEVQAKAREARETADKDRTDEHKALIKEYPFLNVNRGTVYLYLSDRLNGFNKKWDAKQAEVNALRPADDWIHCLTEVPGQIPETKLFSRGDINQPRESVAPGELSVIDRGDAAIPSDNPDLPTTGRRLAYARHLTDGNHPLVARVLVNRFWMLNFGQGLVPSVSDFGTQSQAPLHPELLDWLADEFVSSGWSLKHLQRLMLNSRAYRQSSARTAALDAIDPDNRLLARMPVRRLEAEGVRDALLAIAGELSGKMFGPPVPVAPDEIGQIIVAADNRDSAGRPSGKQASLGEDEFRRSLYVQVRRSMPLGVLEPFDMPSLAPNCEQRSTSTVAPQSLLMMNSPFVVERSKVMAQRLVREVGDDPVTQFQRAWWLTLGREPTAEETAAGVAMLGAQTDHFVAALAPPATGEGDAPATPAATDSTAPRLAALATLCQALVSSNRFLYID